MKSFAVLVSLSVAVCCVWVSQAQGKKNIHILFYFFERLRIRFRKSYHKTIDHAIMGSNHDFWVFLKKKNYNYNYHFDFDFPS